jgi:hypothetical protein
MARVRVVGSVTVQGSTVTLPVKRVYSLGPVIQRAMVDATAVQLRVLAEETREYIIDRIYAGPPFRSPPGGRMLVRRPPKLRAPEMHGEERRPFRHVALSERTREKKANPDRELDARKLIGKGDYTYGIEVKRGEQRESGVNYIVRPAPRQHKGADPRSGRITSRMLARVLEFGSRRHNIPARPHWGPALRAAIRRFRESAPGIRAEALRRTLREMR